MKNVTSYSNYWKLLLSCFLIFTNNIKLAQAQDSSRIQISLLTCSPGDELYSTFGHSALRVIDSNSVTDHVYNYGTFNFDDEDFYLKFVKGQLKYYVNVENFSDFKFAYIAENRSITEQILNLTSAEKIAIKTALIENIKEENKYYLYDFFFDNCTTRLRDIIVKYHQPTPNMKAVMPSNYTFRNAIHQYLDNGNKPWSKLGIDLLLGAPTDAVMTTNQQAFLPDNLMHQVYSVNNSKLTTSSNKLFEVSTTKIESSLFTPMLLFCSILLFYVLLYFINNTYVQRCLQFFDFLLFFIVGAFGCLLVFMWVGTDHIMTKNNYNLLWAWPFFLVYAFVMNSQSKIVKTWSLLTSIFLILLVCCWFFVAQQFNNALLPLVGLLIFRTWSRIAPKNNQHVA
ncbi:DUF4105 domain-containing protein [Ferruginibacter yonginensis]|uniref:DUF4105 domain-containing protein n=1 Tax=Ferruginibacter yonginensis TaxID=1310416 RepID=A0ABV8QPM2_9BACT